MANNRRYRKKRSIPIDNYQPPFSKELLEQGTDILTLREDTKTLLDGALITTILNVVKRQDKDFYKISTFNKKNLLDLKKALKAHGLFLKPTQDAANEKSAKELGIDEEKTKGKGQSQERGQRDRRGQREQRQSNHPRQQTQRERKEPAYVETTRVVRPEKPRIQAERETPDIYVKVNKNGKWGFKNRSGKQMIEPIYDEVFNFKEELCCAQKDDYYGYIDRDGNEVIPFMYSCGNSFSEGFACVFKGEKCGYINAQNEVVVNFEFDAGTAVVGGECRVKKEGRWGELHIKLPQSDTDNTDDATAIDADNADADTATQESAQPAQEIGVENIRWII